MKLGLVTDIHEHVEYLQTALDRFQIESVDQVVVIGDVFRIGDRIEETCQLLKEANTIGVWGNHDFGLCVDPNEEFRTKYGNDVVDFMTSLKPRLDVAECHFTHVEPWLDPEDVTDLWYFEGPPDEPSKLDRIFKAVPNRIMFGGHYHSWLMATPDGIEDWSGEQRINLTEGRFFVVIGAICEGRYAIFDTKSSELVPFNEEQN